MRYALTETKKELLLKENVIVKEKKIKTQILGGIFALSLMILLSIFLYMKKLKTQKKC